MGVRGQVQGQASGAVKGYRVRCTYGLVMRSGGAGSGAGTD